MMNLKNKKIIAGICGGIAAYKTAGVVSKLVQAGADLQVMMTHGAKEFITPLTFQALTGKPVLSDIFRDNPLAHVNVAHAAELFVIMPATYHIVGKLAAGLADDMLTTTLAASRAPILLVPAMESQMYSNPIYQQNQALLERLGYRFVPPEVGYLASGRQGSGRFPTEEKVLRAIATILQDRTLLAKKRILITAGPTREMIDPMRCITNKSSGKMGFAIAEQAQQMGAEKVLLIAGPTQLQTPTNVEVCRVETAEDMSKTVLAQAAEYDTVIMAAAVADWRPKQEALQKIKKTKRESLSLELEKTPDILKELGKRKKREQVLVGFAAESEHLLENAKKKLEEKNLDLIVANSLTKAGSGPESEANEITLLYRNGSVEALPLLDKHEAARELLLRIAQLKMRQK
jgi:phosphopantothenoylcysteine decarboxylase/phosphopantothenate--cysteine ligase